MELETIIFIDSPNDVTKHVKDFKRHHTVTPHWIINKKVYVIQMRKLGFRISYLNGYFFTKKTLEEFNSKPVKYDNVGMWN